MGSKLPQGWCEVQLGQLIHFVVGGDWGYEEEPLDGKSYSAAYCIRSGEFKNWRRLKGQNAVLRYFRNDSLSKRQLVKGDVLLEISGGGPDQPVGRTVIIDEDVLKKNVGTPKIFTNFLRLLRFNKEVNSSYVNYFLELFYQSKRVVDYQGGSNNLRNLKFQKYITIQVPLPPFNEQKRIVAKLDAIYSHIDNIENKFRGLSELTSTFVESCLTDPRKNEVYPRELLGAFLEEETTRIGANWRDLKKVGVSAQDGIIKLATGQKQSFEKYKIVRPGDFVYNAMRVNIGSIAIYEGEEIALTSPDYVVFRVKHTISPRLLLYFLKSQRGLLEIGANTQGSVRSRLYFKSLSQVRYPIAPKGKQNEADVFLNWNQQMELSLKKRFTGLMDGIKQTSLNFAFKGHLVPQNVDDEPASKLLKRIERQEELLIPVKKKNENKKSLGFKVQKH